MIKAANTKPPNQLSGIEQPVSTPWPWRWFFYYTERRPGDGSVYFYCHNRTDRLFRWLCLRLEQLKGYL